MALYFAIATWGLVAFFTFFASWRVFRGKGEQNDPPKWAFFLTAALMLAFNLRWIVYKDSLGGLNELRWISGVLALYILAIVRFYKRGA